MFSRYQIDTVTFIYFQKKFSKRRRKLQSYFKYFYEKIDTFALQNVSGLAHSTLNNFYGILQTKACTISFLPILRNRSYHVHIQWASNRSKSDILIIKWSFCPNWVNLSSSSPPSIIIVLNSFSVQRLFNFILSSHPSVVLLWILFEKKKKDSQKITRGQSTTT